MSAASTTLVSANPASLESTVSATARRVKDYAQTGGLYLSKAVYTTCYCASYGVTFPVVLLAHAIPGTLPLAAGIADGARAAGVYVRGVRVSQKRMHRHTELTEEHTIEEL